jgi:hypothetical protein
LDYAERVARAHVVGASRQLEVEFCVPFERLWQVDLDTSIDVTHDGLPGGRIVGKVISYQLRATSECWVVWVKIAAAVDAGNVVDTSSVAAEFLDDYVLGDYVAEYANDWPLLKVAGDVPRDPSLFRVSDLVESIAVKGDGNRQMEVLQAAQYPAVTHYKDSLRDEAFSLEVKFMDLQPKSSCEMRWERAFPIVVC